MPPQPGHEHSEKRNPQARTKSPQIHVSFKPSDGNQVLSVLGVKQAPRCEPSPVKIKIKYQASPQMRT
ncbi:hypothetical protein FOTG_00129 [Fusarium oxysporum f. sp. vasinfectum 25433]|uniref:Uncharacterized protein n=1 Tax=Fusarium oxysporum f. sp. vasinfectum 25433 TaxID=1089449 RepID=X0MC23_FUSOX|nr:hypothetical protein FOTG_00129 [Fusarium oxysporum f. sp. vasinfectum 25433]